jgi:hypothetical protein
MWCAALCNCAAPFEKAPTDVVKQPLDFSNHPTDLSVAAPRALEWLTS